MFQKFLHNKKLIIGAVVCLGLIILVLGFWSKSVFIPMVFSQNIESQASCQAREWSCLNNSADYPDVICQTCGTLCVYRIPRNPAFTWLCPSNQDFGQKDGTALLGQTHYYFDYDLGKIQIRGPLPPP